MYFGADYYPEHWPKERWAADAKLMRDANLNIVRMAEFAWSRLEPSEGCLDFAWLDEAISLLNAQGIKAVLGTPTATPPKWLCDQYPDFYPQDEFGQERGFGARRHYCYHHPGYLEHSRRIAAQMAAHYRDHPGVAAWQIDNELSGRCFCPHCLRAFRGWLKDRYLTTDALNDAWGTAFWSETYNSWEEVILPAYNASYGETYTHGHNPGLWLDFCRFSSDAAVSFQRLQTEAIRKASSLPITSNLMGFHATLDYYDLGKDLDFISWDNYPNHQWSRAPYESVAMQADQMRGIKQQNIWVMEQQSGPCGWGATGDTPEPGQLRLWAWQAVARGAEHLLFFRWRTCAFGTEIYWYGILDHDGIPRRRYREIAATGAEMRRLADKLADAEVAADTVLVRSYENVWSHGLHPHNHRFSYDGLIAAHYSALIHHHIGTDILSPLGDFSGYKLMVMPAFNLISADIQSRVEAYVRSGKTLVVTFRSGTRTVHNQVTQETLPGAFRQLAGIELEEFDSLNNGRTVRIHGLTEPAEASVWCDVIAPVTAQPLAWYQDGFYAGKPAITVNAYGKGKVFYIGCDLPPEAMDRLMRHIAAEAGVQPLLPQPAAGVETVMRVKNGKTILALLNHNHTGVTVEVPGVYTNLIDGAGVSDTLTLPPYGVGLLEM
jgi:beta-galactosidase